MANDLGFIDPTAGEEGEAVNSDSVPRINRGPGTIKSADR